MSFLSDAASASANGPLSKILVAIKPYINIARPDHWFKNIFMLPGLLLALAVGATLPENFILRVVTELSQVSYPTGIVQK